MLKSPWSPAFCPPAGGGEHSSWPRRSAGSLPSRVAVAKPGSSAGLAGVTAPRSSRELRGGGTERRALPALDSRGRCRTAAGRGRAGTGQTDGQTAALRPPELLGGGHRGEGPPRQDAPLHPRPRPRCRHGVGVRLCQRRFKRCVSSRGSGRSYCRHAEASGGDDRGEEVLEIRSKMKRGGRERSWCFKAWFYPALTANKLT